MEIIAYSHHVGRLIIYRAYLYREYDGFYREKIVINLLYQGYSIYDAFLCN